MVGFSAAPCDAELYVLDTSISSPHGPAGWASVRKIIGSCQGERSVASVTAKYFEGKP
jgi:hypothetical protein